MKNKFTILVFSAAALIGFKAQAQTVTWKELKNDPFDIKNLTIALDPLFFDLNSQNGYAMGWGLRADFLMGKALQFNFDYRNSFNTKGYHIDNNNTKNYNYIEGGVGLVLSHKVKTRNLPIILERSSYSSGGYTYTKTTFIKGGVPGKVRSIFMLQGGFFMYGNTINFNSIDDSLITLKDGSTEFSLQDSIAVFEANDSLNKYDMHFGGGNITSLFLGFNFKNIRQLILDVDGYGVKGNVMFRDFYLHAMFAPIVDMKDYTANGTKYGTHYGKVSHFGWRMGWFIRHPKNQSFSYKFEFGTRPGWRRTDTSGSFGFMKNMYTTISFGLYLPFKVKPIAEEE